MPQVKNVEKKIWHLEGFDVAITQNGKDVRGDKSNFKQWDGQRQTRNDSTVADFVKKFENKYPGYSVNVLHPNGNVAHGSKKLGNLRDEYNEDEL